MDERSSLGTVSKRGCFFRNARARNTHVEETLNHPCAAQVDDDEKTVDVMYDDGGEDDDEISRKRILAVVAPKPEGRAIQLTTYLNLARCATRADRAKDAVSCCTLAGGRAAKG